VKWDINVIANDIDVAEDEITGISQNEVYDPLCDIFYFLLSL